MRHLIFKLKETQLLNKNPEQTSKTPHITSTPPLRCLPIPNTNIVTKTIPTYYAKHLLKLAKPYTRIFFQQTYKPTTAKTILNEAKMEQFIKDIITPEVIEKMIEEKVKQILTLTTPASSL